MFYVKINKNKNKLERSLVLYLFGHGMMTSLKILSLTTR